jgi:hypothetical protein
VAVAALEGSLHTRVNNAPWPPFGCNRAEAVLAELGLGEAATAAYRAMCGRRDARDTATGYVHEPGIGGIDAATRIIACMRVLRAVGGLAAAARWDATDEPSRDLRRWLALEDGAPHPVAPVAPAITREGLGKRRVSRERWSWRRETVAPSVQGVRGQA